MTHTPAEFREVSFLGTGPFCQRCGKDIVAGETAIQIFTGFVMNLSDPPSGDESELAIVSNDQLGYQVYHEQCK